MSITQVDNRLKFLPLGLLWGFVAGGFHTYHVLSLGSSDDQVNWLVPIGTIACCSLIALPLGSAMLKRELSTIRWVVNWMITGMASSAGGVAIFYPIFFFGDALLRPTPLALSDPIFFVADLLGGSLIIGLGVLARGWDSNRYRVRCSGSTASTALAAGPPAHTPPKIRR